MLIHNETELARFTHPVLGLHILYHQAPGLYVAGSGMIERKEAWGVCYSLSGCRHGRRFTTEANARLYFSNSGAYRVAA